MASSSRKSIVFFLIRMYPKIIVVKGGGKGGAVTLRKGVRGQVQAGNKLIILLSFTKCHINNHELARKVVLITLEYHS